jgi:hypothetical protein
MILQGSDYHNKMKHHDGWNIEQFIKFHLAEHSILNKVILFPYIMYAVRPKDGATRWSYGQYSRKHGYYIKYMSEYIKAYAFKDLFKKSKLSINDFYLINLQESVYKND